MSLASIIPPPPPPELAVPSLLLIALIDCRRLEIDPWLCAIAAISGGILAAPDSPWADGLLGAAVALSGSLAIRARRPSSMGLGDLYLYAICGFLVGASGLAAWAALHAVAALLLALPRAVRRRRRLHRTGMPAAATACPSVVLVMLLR